jgi:hypothetical protein
MSALTLIADIRRGHWYVRLVPEADIGASLELAEHSIEFFGMSCEYWFMEGAAIFAPDEIISTGNAMSISRLSDALC